MGKSQSTRERVFSAAGCAAVTGLAKKRKGKESVAGWLCLRRSNSLPALPLASRRLRSPSPSRCWAVSLGAVVAPGRAAGAAAVVGGPWELDAAGRRGLRQDLEWFALCWERVNWEGCWAGGKEDIVDFSGSCNISNT